MPNSSSFQISFIINYHEFIASSRKKKLQGTLQTTNKGKTQHLQPSLRTAKDRTDHHQLNR